MRNSTIIRGALFSLSAMALSSCEQPYPDANTRYCNWYKDELSKAELQNRIRDFGVCTSKESSFSKWREDYLERTGGELYERYVQRNALAREHFSSRPDIEAELVQFTSVYNQIYDDIESSPPSLYKVRGILSYAPKEEDETENYSGFLRTITGDNEDERVIFIDLGEFHPADLSKYFFVLYPPSVEVTIKQNEEFNLLSAGRAVHIKVLDDKTFEQFQSSRFDGAWTIETDRK